MPSKYTADDIMEIACEQFCKWPEVYSEDEDQLLAQCEQCKLDRMIRRSVRN